MRKRVLALVLLSLSLFGCAQEASMKRKIHALTANDDPETYLEAWKGDDKSGQKATFYKFSHGTDYSGDYPQLSDVGWGDDIRSVRLVGKPGTTVRLYDLSNFRTRSKTGGWGPWKDDDAIEIKIPEGQSEVIVNKIDSTPVTGVTWIKDPGNDNKGLAGKVSSLQWP